MKKRNIAIIAHVDHGKTTLVDQLLRQSGTFRDNENVDERAMDSNDIERERGITILAKPTAINYKDYRINILDTPGHADFGGEVERIMHMVDGVLLVVDAYEGCMPQTKFVLKKALEAGHKVIVVINKIDKPTARASKVIDELIDLFLELEANDEQLDFPICYTSAINGTSSLEEDLSTQKETMDPLFELIINTIPEPNNDIDGAFQFQPALLDYNDYVGRIGIGKVNRGKVKVNEMVSCVRLDGSIKKFRVQKLYGYLGLKRIELEEAEAGDVIAISGLPDLEVGETICTDGKEEALTPLKIDEPTLQMTFGVNSSPFVGREGKFVTASKIEERLKRQAESDVSLKIEQNTNDSWIVSGRGELHLSILIENMRREGYEMEVSKPKAILKEINGQICEPYEDVQIEAPEDAIGSIIESLATRGGVMDNMTNLPGLVRLNYTIPSRGLIGFQTDFMTMTKGFGVLNHAFKEYLPKTEADVGERKIGVLVSMENGQSTAYALGGLEDRGTMFITPGTDVYEGMIVGENNRDNDLAVNVVKGKNLTNTRSAGKDHTVVLKKSRTLSLEEALEYINQDELLEVTPENYRMRKKILNTEERKKFDARKDN